MPIFLYAVVAIIYIATLMRTSQQGRGAEGIVVATVFCVILTIGVVIFHISRRNAAKGRERGEISKRQANETFRATAESHRDALIRRYRQTTFVDDYGGMDTRGWEREMARFHKSVHGRELNKLNRPRFAASMRQIVESWLAEETSPSVLQVPTDPYEYERYCAEVLKRAGWNARVTQATGDQGVDVLAEKEELRVAIQCKLYGSPVGNKAVQEVHAASGFFDAPIAVVVSNNGYTRSAEQLAGKLSVHLLHHNDLPRLDETVRSKGRSGQFL